MAGLGAAKVTALDWVVIGAGLLAYISSLLPWYNFTASVPILGITRSASANAWHAGIGAWLSVLMLVAAAAVVLASTFGGRLRRTASRSLITLILTVLAFITIALRWATFPDANGGLDRVGELGEFNLGDGSLGGAFSVTSGAGYGLYLGLIAAIAAAVASLITFRAASNVTD
ncbi:MAG: hypothetical protein QOG46_1199 [Pseudonocardiales bacterium]|jgi:hypothetical protein|nr:hypothetical protein [Pseudonocardiales bacterium]